MKVQDMSCVLYAIVVTISLFIFVSDQVSALGEKNLKRDIEEQKRSDGLSRRADLSWLSELPKSVPQWLKKSSKTYPGSPPQIVCAVKKLAKALKDMEDAQARNCDDYFRCRGSRDAAKCGDYAAAFANHISYKQEWRTAGMDRHYNRYADVFGSSGGDCLAKYKYGTYGTSHACTVPWNFQ